MIPVGTLCIVVGSHEAAGHFCTVVGGAEFVSAWAGAERKPHDWRYQVDFADKRRPPHGRRWMLREKYLLPVAAPGLTEGTYIHDSLLSDER